MTEREALRMALDELCRVYHDDEAGPYTLEVIKTIKQALEQPEPEPVAIVSSVAEAGEKGVRVRWIGGFPQIGDRLYTSPPKRETTAPATPQPPIYYMRDNHTFKRLSDDISTALIEIEQEFNEGCTYGMLCSKRPNFKDIHASGSKKRLEFFAECKAALEAAHGIGEKK